MPSSTQASNSSLETMRVLYVEDEADIRKQLARFFEMRVGTLIVGENGQQGLRLFTKQKPDIVITDIVMPEMDGMTMAKHIKEIDQDVPIIVTTAFNDTEYFLEAIEIGIEHYAIKPVDYNALTNTLIRAAKKVALKRDVITKTKQLQIAADVFDGSMEGIVVADPEERIISINRAFSKMTGYSPEEILGKKLGFMQSGFQDGSFYDGMWKAIMETGTWCGEIMNKTKNGNIVPYWLTIRAIKNESGQINYYVGWYNDYAWHSAQIGKTITPRVTL